MKATTQAMKSVTIILTDRGIVFRDLPLIVAEHWSNGSAYYEFESEVSKLDVTSDALSHEAWLFILDVIEYSINEGGDMSRALEAGDTHPAFTYQVN